jgi:hypothetical protein
MRRLRIHSICFALIPTLCAAAVGCGPPAPARTESPKASTAAAPPPPAAPSIALADLLKKSRAELANLFDETAAQVQIREKGHRDGSITFGLLPRVRLPLIVPVWTEASYSTNAKVSLPPYAVENAKDNHLAMHLARFGDREAAQQLAEPSDAAIGKQIDSLAYERNYPAEWTRIVALMLHTAEYRLAAGDDEGRAELAFLHKQLHELLDAKAAAGPLGAALLGQGHKVLTLAAAEWRQTGHPGLADKADADLAAWGDFPAPAFAVPFGSSAGSVADLLRSQRHGKAVVALTTNRALDLFALPVTSEGTEGVFALFDAADKLAEVLVVYRPRIADYYLEPEHLVLPLEDHGIAGKEFSQAASVHRRDYRVGSSTCEVSVVPRGYVLGAYIRFAGNGQPAAPTLPRDFGSVNLSRSYGQNRVRLVPEQVGDIVQTTRALSLAKLSNPLAPQLPTMAALRREGWYDLVKSFSLFYNVEEDARPLFQVALPLWSAFGPSRIGPFEDKEGGGLMLTWQDAATRYALQIPHVSGHPFEFEATDARGPDSLRSRVTAAAELDAAERKARFESKQPLLRIPRRVEIGWSNPPVAVGLEMTRDQVAAIVPKSKSIVSQSGPDYLNVLLTGDPPPTAARATRQAFIRFGPDHKVAEIRVRTVAGPAGTSSRWITDMMAGLVKASGAALESPATWPTIWNDLPALKPAPLFARWQDDASWMTVQRDGTTVEMTIHNCSLNEPAGVPLPPFKYLPRGPEGVALGDSREDLLKRFKIDKPRTLDDGGLVLPPTRGSGYDALIVWFAEDRVNRIVARANPPATNSAKQPPSAGELIAQAWGRSLRSLGWPTRQDTASDGSPQTLGWHDDQTRVRIFAQDGDDGRPRAFTEWKEIAEAKTR